MAHLDADVTLLVVNELPLIDGTRVKYSVLVSETTTVWEILKIKWFLEGDKWVHVVKIKTEPSP